MAQLGQLYQNNVNQPKNGQLHVQYILGSPI